MKYCAKLGVCYDHTPEEWAEVLKAQGAGMSLPGSLAARIGPAFKKPAATEQPNDSGSKRDE